MKLQVLILIGLFMAACAPVPSATSGPATLPPDTAVTSPPEDSVPTNNPQEDPFAPKPGDDKLSRGSIYIDEVSLVIRESYPPQISVSIKGNLPTPCHQLRAEIAPPNSENKIVINAYSVVDSNAVCAQVLEPIEENIDLGTFPTGHYSVWVNDQLAGEFDS